MGETGDQKCWKGPRAGGEGGREQEDGKERVDENACRRKERQPAHPLEAGSSRLEEPGIAYPRPAGRREREEILAWNRLRFENPSPRRQVPTGPGILEHGHRP